LSLHLADAGDSPGVSSSEGEADDQKTVLSLHQLFGDCGHCDAWTPFRSQLDQPARRYACAWGAAVFALFSVLGKKYRYDQVVSVFIYFVTALVFIAPTLVLFSSLACVAVAFPQWLGSERYFLHLLVEGARIRRYLSHLQCVVCNSLSLACLYHALFR